MLLTVSRVEVRSALARARRGGRVRARREIRLWEEFQGLWLSCGQVVVDEALVTEATRLAGDHGLRAYDALQLAGGLLAGAELGARDFLTLDADLTLAARAEGLTTPLDGP